MHASDAQVAKKISELKFLKAEKVEGEGTHLKAARHAIAKADRKGEKIRLKNLTEIYWDWS